MTTTVLITGAAGFIGSHLSEKLLRLGYRVIGLDNFDDYYSPGIKRNNIAAIAAADGFSIVEGDIRDTALLGEIFSGNDVSLVVHLAARAGVRPSIQYPALYQDVNIRGTINLLEASRTLGVKKFIFASSSSVYGLNSPVPFSEEAKIDCPASPYGASKAAAEIFCHTYHQLYGLPVDVLRFFTVYGPRQRPEMAIHMFTRMIDRQEEIPIFGDGTSKRDYTFISDIIEGITHAITRPGRDFQIFNLGNSNPVSLDDLVRLIEDNLGKPARIKRLPMQAGDLLVTWADISKAGAVLSYRPGVKIEAGISRFVKWYIKSGNVVRSASV
jgi:UDP-glucuronate 4-epimerase